MSLLRLLTVDDEAHIHEGLDAIIDWSAIGYEHVGAAMNGIEALRLAQELRPDVILTDIRMPGMDGIELIKSIRAESDLNPIIVVVSGYDDFEYARASMRYQVLDYLLKPIDEDELIAVLLEVKERRVDQRPSVGQRRLGAETEAIRKILSGDRSGAVLAGVESLVARSDGERLVPIILAALTERAALDDPLTADGVSHGLGLTKARDSREWVVDETPLSVLGFVRVPARESEAEQLRLWMRGLHRSLQDALKRRLVLHIGEGPDSAAALPRALSALKTAVSNASPPNSSVVIVHSGSDTPRRTDAPDLSDLLDALESFNAEAAHASVDHAAEQWQRSSASAHSVRDWVMRLRLSVQSLLEELQCDIVEMPADAAVRSVSRLAEYLTISATADVLHDYVGEAVRVVASCRAQNRNSVIALIQRRVRRRYARELSLTEFAGHYDMNPVYLGQLFRKVVGEGFRDYLRGVRVREAMRLLRDTDLHVPEVGRVVGYRDSDFFADQFKRETGVTPAAYRRDTTQSK